MIRFLISGQCGRNSSDPKDWKPRLTRVESLARCLMGLLMVLGSITGASSTASNTFSATVKEISIIEWSLERWSSTSGLLTCLTCWWSTWPGRRWCPCCARCRPSPPRAPARPGSWSRGSRSPAWWAGRSGPSAHR